MNQIVELKKKYDGKMKVLHVKACQDDKVEYNDLSFEDK